MRIAICFVAAFLSAAAVGCASTDEEGTPAPAPTPAAVPDDDDDSAVYSRTIIQHHADGTETVTVGQITRAEQRAEIAAREAFLAGGGAAGARDLDNVVRDCSQTNALWLFDQTFLHGNEVCLYEYGPQEFIYGLGHFRRAWVCNKFNCYWDDWNFAVRSYWAGDQWGGFFDEQGLIERFTPYQRADGVSYVIRMADSVFMRNHPPL